MEKPAVPLTLANILYPTIIGPLYVKGNVLSIYETQYYSESNIRYTVLNIHEIPLKPKILIDDEIILGIPESIFTCKIIF